MVNTEDVSGVYLIGALLLVAAMVYLYLTRTGKRDDKHANKKYTEDELKDMVKKVGRRSSARSTATDGLRQ